MSGRFLPASRQRCWLPWVLASAACFAGWVHAAGAVDTAIPTPVADAHAWLTRIHTAANTGNYRGTLVSSMGGSMTSARVAHYCVGDQTFEELEALDGRQQHIYRHNADVHTLWLQTRVVVVERRETLAGWQATPQAVEPGLLEQYQLRPEGRARVAGREADVVVLEPRDELRYAQRLWIDRASGLMLRADVLGQGADRAVLESTAFSDVEIGVKPQPVSAQMIAARIDGFKVVRPMQQRTQLEDEGWVLTRSVAGFHLRGCVKRLMDVAPRSPPSQSSPRPAAVLQAVFSDGLAHVSVFIEPFDAQRHKSEGRAHLGATSTVTQRRQDFWLTTVGDAPATTLKRLANSLERRR